MGSHRFQSGETRCGDGGGNPGSVVRHATGLKCPTCADPVPESTYPVSRKDARTQSLAKESPFSGSGFARLGVFAPLREVKTACFFLLRPDDPCPSVFIRGFSPVYPVWAVGALAAAIMPTCSRFRSPAGTTVTGRCPGNNVAPSKCAFVMLATISCPIFFVWFVVFFPFVVPVPVFPGWAEDRRGRNRDRRQIAFPSRLQEFRHRHDRHPAGLRRVVDQRPEMPQVAGQQVRRLEPEG